MVTKSGLIILSFIFFFAATANAATLRCGTSTDLPGYGVVQNGQFTGFEVELCKAFAIAVTGSASNVAFVPTTSANRFALIANNTVDVVTRGTFPTVDRVVRFNIRFTRSIYNDLGGVVVRSDSNIDSQAALANYFSTNGNSKRICYNEGSLSAEEVIRLFGANTGRSVPTTTDALNGVTSGDCIGYINTLGNIYGQLRQSRLLESDYNIITLDNSTIDSLAAFVSKERARLLLDINWVISGLILAWDQGITRGNVDSIDINSVNDNAKRMLGYNTFDPLLPRNYEVPGIDITTMTMTDIIRTVGNWYEIFNRTLAVAGIPLERINLPTTKGGLQYIFRW